MCARVWHHYHCSSAVVRLSIRATNKLPPAREPERASRLFPRTCPTVPATATPAASSSNSLRPDKKQEQRHAQPVPLPNTTPPSTPYYPPSKSLQYLHHRRLLLLLLLHHHCAAPPSHITSCHHHHHRLSNRKLPRQPEQRRPYVKHLHTFALSQPLSSPSPCRRLASALPLPRKLKLKLPLLPLLPSAAGCTPSA